MIAITQNELDKLRICARAFDMVWDSLSRSEEPSDINLCALIEPHVESLKGVYEAIEAREVEEGMQSAAAAAAARGASC